MEIVEPKHAKKETNFEWGKPETKEQIRVISYEPPKDEWYKARITTLERENLELRKEIEKRAEWYGMGKDALDTRAKELAAENSRLLEENFKLRSALVREAIRDV